MGLFGGNNAQVQTSASTSTSAPWSAAQPYLQNYMKQAQGLNSQGNAPFRAPGFQTWVDPSQATQQAQQGIMGVAGQGNPLAGQSMDALSGILQGNDNPYYQGQVNKQANMLGDDLARQWSGGGRFGSANMATDVGQQVGNLRDQMFSSNWQQNVANQLNAVQAAPGAYNQQYSPFEHMAQVGQQQEGYAANKLQAQISADQQNRMAAYNRMQAQQGLLNGMGQQGGTTVGTQTQSTTNPKNYASALGGGLLGAQAGQAMGGSGMFGGLAGLLGGIFG